MSLVTSYWNAILGAFYSMHDENKQKGILYNDRKLPIQASFIEGYLPLGP